MAAAVAGCVPLFLSFSHSDHSLTLFLTMQAIWEELQETVHAVDAMVTQTPEEAGL